MDKVENGLFVSVDYKGTLDNGDVFDTSNGREPLEVQMGAGQLIKGFEDALMDMKLNEKKTFTIDPEDAYGLRDEERTHTFDRKELPPELDPQVGEVLALMSPEGHQMPAKVAQADENSITVDLNHPLAGEALTFEIEIVGINDSPTQTQDCGCGCGCETDEHGGCDSGCC